MTYWLDLFTPDTWAAFRASGGTISGFRESRSRTAQRVKPGDLFLCYLVRVSRWCGILRVESAAFRDSTSIFDTPDPFIVRFKVEPLVALDVTESIPIFENDLWGQLTFTRNLGKRSPSWAQSANLRASLRVVSDEDGKLLVGALEAQAKEKRPFPLSIREKRRLDAKRVIRTPDRVVVVEVPDEGVADELEELDALGTARESHRIQARLAGIGARMNFRVWIPRADRGQVSSLLPQDIQTTILQELPLNYDDSTLRTIEQIDVIWLRNRSMARAFEVEHTTSIYSGLLRMADLLALQPNMDIRLHIVAPDERREKVHQELKRPVFSLLERGPLYESCTFLPYSAIDEISKIPHLQHMQGSIIEEYEESAQDD
jgi:hypothetical protein